MTLQLHKICINDPLFPQPSPNHVGPEHVAWTEWGIGPQLQAVRVRVTLRVRVRVMLRMKVRLGLGCGDTDSLESKALALILNGIALG